MNDRDTKNLIIRTLIFIMLGSVMIVAADIFIMRENQNTTLYTKYTELKDKFTNNMVDVSALRAQHEQYMNHGIIQPELYAANRPAFPPPNMPDQDEAIIQHDTRGGELVESASLDEILGRIKDEESLANIEPAMGITEDIVQESFKKPDEQPSTPPIKKVSDIISDLKNPVTPVSYTPDITESDETQIAVKTPQNDVKYIEPKGEGQVVIIIDDMGVSLRSKLVEVMPAGLTLAYLPYAENLSERTKRAIKNGHEVMVHVPMEAMKESLDGGPKVLQVSQSDDELKSTLDWALSQFDGYVGINNHMGSRLTQDRHAMQLVMNTLKSKGLYFIDSKTIGSSVAAEVARETGIPYAERDVFLDHDMSLDAVRAALKQLEQTAYRKGYAIAIGHPHKDTIAALKEWLPTLEEKGLTLVPASAVLKHPAGGEPVADNAH